jgi:biopolymer transport protein ExbD
MKVEEWGSGVMSEINVTPMVDVMLVLLIIFMVVTPALLAGFKATLPEGDNLKERPEEEARTTLGIDLAGNYYLNTTAVSASALPDMLVNEFLSHPEDKVLFIKADKDLPYGELMKAMDMARNAGARVVAAVSTQRAESAKQQAKARRSREGG